MGVLLPGIPTLCRATPRTTSGFMSKSSFLWSVQRFGSTLYLRDISVSCDGSLGTSLCGFDTLPCGIVSLTRDCDAPRHPTETGSAAPLHLERFVARTVERPAAQAEKQFDCLPSVLTRWLRRPHRPRRTSDAPASSCAVYPASAFRLTALSLPLLCQARPRTIR